MAESYMVRKERLELSRRKTLEPKSSASTNFATSAQNPLKTICRAQTRREMVSQNVSRFNDSGPKWGSPKAGPLPDLARHFAGKTVEFA
jgi:hypothetical protein